MISASASSWVKPRATKDPSMSFCTVLFGPNRSAAVALAMLSKVSKTKAKKRNQFGTSLA